MKALTPLLNVEDAGRSVNFYCEKLGFAVNNRFEDNGALKWAHISRGPIEMMINVSSEHTARGRVEERRRTMTLFCISQSMMLTHFTEI